MGAGGAFGAEPAAALGDAFAEASAVFVSAGLPADALDEDAAPADEAALSAEAVDEFLETGNVKALRNARKRFMRLHGVVFWILGVMQWYWYSNDRRRERFVSICRDRDVQKLTWDAYMNKELVRAKPVAHVRIFFKNLAHMAGLASA